jgi:UDP-glucose 4-epimerase
LHYYRQNVDGAVALAEAMVEAGVREVVYSSSAAVYGAADVDLITEDTPTVPVSPYGETKLIGEWVFRDAAVAHGLSVVALRYFNVAGAGADDLGDTGAFNLVPMALRALTRGERPQVFGADYPTPDGTCIRDYIHVADLADPHLEALRYLERGGASEILNCGYGHGFSVREVIDTVARVAGVAIAVKEGARRPGDPAVLVASNAKIRKVLGWEPRHDDLTAIVETAWAWEQKLQARLADAGAPAP